MRLLGAAARLSQRTLVDRVLLTRAQIEVMQDDSSIVVHKAANRIGKTYGMVWDCIQTARNQMPHRDVPRGPKRLMVMGDSWDQMAKPDHLFDKFADLIPWDEMDGKLTIERGQGVRGVKRPVLTFKRGPGAGSRIYFGTYEQGSKAVAGAAADYVYCDEPMPGRLYGELRTRLLTTGGKIRIYFTPVPGMSSQAYLRALCENGQASLHEHYLEEQWCWPVTASRPFLYQAQIDEYLSQLPEHVRGMRGRGEWEPMAEGRLLSGFGTPNVAPVELSDFDGSWEPWIGIDHGTTGNKQAMMLGIIWGRHTDRPRVRWLAERVSDGFTLPEHDAQALVSMCRENGIDPRSIKHWVGDRSLQMSTQQLKKSNARLKREIAKVLRCDAGELPWIRTPSKYEGSVFAGCEIMNALFLRTEDDGTPHGIVDPSCEHFIKFCETFKGDSRDPLKDVGDAGRYPVEYLATHVRVAPVAHRLAV